ncbi:MAG: hypothetical protein IPH95_10940 [Candidatus Promineofilum sp.]|nr:hypothetical protein [Promineifilum sp.]
MPGVGGAQRAGWRSGWRACRARGGRALVAPTDGPMERSAANWWSGRWPSMCASTRWINNAGLSMWMKLEDVEDLGSLEYIMRVNFFGSLYCTYYAPPHLKRSRGRIFRGHRQRRRAHRRAARHHPHPHRLIPASKHAMVGFFESLRIEVEDDGISVTISFPDFVASVCTPARWGRRPAVGPQPAVSGARS